MLFIILFIKTMIARLRWPERPPEQSPIPIGSGNLCMCMENQMVIHSFHFSWSEWPVPWFASAWCLRRRRRRRRWWRRCHTSYPGPLFVNRRKFFHCQLTAVTTRYPLTSIAWPYRGLKNRPHRGHVFYFLSLPLTQNWVGLSEGWCRYDVVSLWVLKIISVARKLAT